MSLCFIVVCIIILFYGGLLISFINLKIRDRAYEEIKIAKAFRNREKEDKWNLAYNFSNNFIYVGILSTICGFVVLMLFILVIGL